MQKRALSTQGLPVRGLLARNAQASTQTGSTLLDVVVGTAILLTVFVGFFGVLQLGTRLATDNKSRTGALALALERIEFIRSLDYASVGTSGGDPLGTLAQNEAIVLNGISYNRRTHIVWIDDPKDGTGGSDSNGVTNDYKRVKIEVTWQGQTGQRSSSIVSDVTPPGIEQ